MAQLIRASLAFTELAVADLLSFLNAVYAGIKDNPAFTVNLPVDMATFKTAIDSFAAAVTAALDGSKTAMAERNHQREGVLEMLRHLAHYVEAASKGNLTVFLSSGFQVRSTARAPAQPLSQFIRRIDSGDKSGQMFVTIIDVPDAYSYQVRWTPAVPAGTAPIWTIESVGTTRPPFMVESLTPGTAYMFQARALTDSGFTDWSDPITRICT